jgi:hypothetical protein
MNLPFTLEQLLQVFEEYNLAVWPMQVAALILGLVAVYFAIRPTRHSTGLITAILAVFWLWTGIGFVLLRFGPIYPPAYGFAVLYTFHGILFLSAIPKPRLSFRFKLNGYGITGILLIAYAILGYPLFGTFLDHNYPQSMAFGLTPCPVTVFTFGLYLLTDKPIPKLFLLVPLLWGLGGVIPASIGILEDIGLVVAGVLGTALILYRDRQSGAIRIHT